MNDVEYLHYMAALGNERLQKEHQEEIDNLNSRIKKLKSFIEDIAKYGLRCDNNPTWDSRQNGIEVYAGLTSYFTQAERRLRDRAIEALE